jgi:hypothetical protein
MRTLRVACSTTKKAYSLRSIHRVQVEEVARHDAVGLGGQELRPGRA